MSIENQKNLIKFIENSNYKGFVYFAQVKNRNLFKIGFTKNISERLRQLHTANPDLKYYDLIGTMDDNYKKLEKIIHSYFKDNIYIKGKKHEFYEISGQMIKDYIKKYCSSDKMGNFKTIIDTFLDINKTYDEKIKNQKGIIKKLILNLENFKHGFNRNSEDFYTYEDIMIKLRYYWRDNYQKDNQNLGNLKKIIRSVKSIPKKKNKSLKRDIRNHIENYLLPSINELIKLLKEKEKFMKKNKEFI